MIRPLLYRVLVGALVLLVVGCLLGLHARRVALLEERIALQSQMIEMQVQQCRALEKLNRRYDDVLRDVQQRLGLIQGAQGLGGPP